MQIFSAIAGQAATASAASQQRLVGHTDIRLSEIISAMSVALDITTGQPAGHAMRNALVGMRLARELRLSSDDRSSLYYALLLKDLGCSSNAAKMSYLFAADDRAVKQASKLVDWTRTADKLKYAYQQVAPGRPAWEKMLQLAAMARCGEEGARQLIEVRCERGADIARRLGFPQATSLAILALDEHWNGQGHPKGVRGEQIPLLGRICCLAQTVEVFHTTYGLAAAMEMAQSRSGEWFDPQLVDALLAIRRDEPFWQTLHSDDLASELARWEPADTVRLADEAMIDRVAEAFASVVDAKSPWTFQHSTRVAEIAVGIAGQFGCSPPLLTDIRRAGLLHDIGKLGVSNRILDKPGKPTAAELAEIQRHPDYSQRILSQVEAFRDLADVASGHHERLDGSGYHRRLDNTTLPWAARVLAVADIAEALSAKRPYRDAVPWERIWQMMADDAGLGLDADCVAALSQWHDRTGLESRVEAQLQEVERLLGEVG